MRDKKVVIIGGGTGLYTALSGLKHYSRDITAIVTMADDGGSSGRLRDEFGHLPPGDARRCLVALSPDRHTSRTLRTLFEYRFDKGDGLSGHNFGNLLLTALTEMTGSTELAIEEAARLLNIQGTVLPITTDDVRLCAELEDGTIIRGEHNIDVRKVKPDMKIDHIFLAPNATVHGPAIEAILDADILILGPGDLYTSLLPNILVQGVPEAIQACKGVRIYACNLMTKHGETDNFTASQFVTEVTRYIGAPGSVDAMIVNNATYDTDTTDTYAAENAKPVRVDMDACRALVPHVLADDIGARGNLVRHDSQKLARMIFHAAQAFDIDSQSATPALVPA